MISDETAAELTDMWRETFRRVVESMPTLDDLRMRFHRDEDGQLWVWYYRTGWVPVREP